MLKRLGVWNVRSLYGSGSLRTVARELAKCVGFCGSTDQMENGDSELVDNYTLLCGNGNENHELGTGFFIHKGMISAAKRAEFVGDGMPCIIQRDRWYGITF
jgi:hypothetical protein